MDRSIRIARVAGIPIVINLSWLITLGFVTTLLAIRVYPEVLPPGSVYRQDAALHWLMAIVSGTMFFVSILLHELAHSLVARKQGIGVKSITLFIFGGVSQISGESTRPLHEFVMAIVGPLTSLLLGAIFLGLWAVTGFADGEPYAIVLEWLGFMNVVLAVFNMAPGFPMDGGRVLRSILWGVTHNQLRSTRLATLVSRGIGFAMIGAGGVALLGVVSFIDPWSGVWFIVLGLFLESSARQSWVQARALNVLAQFRAEDIMTPDLVTAEARDELRYLLARGGRRFIFFVLDDYDHVVGVLTEKEAAQPDGDPRATASQLMIRPENFTVAPPNADGASLFQTMESASIWHLPIVSDGRVLGVVSRENLIRLLARGLAAEAGLVARPS
jgi:Zn-dependent protease